MSVTTENMAETLLQLVQEDNWNFDRLFIIAATLELEYLTEINHSMQWQAQRLQPLETSIEGDIVNNETFLELLRRAISERHDKVVVLSKTKNNLVWVAIIYKGTNDDFLEKPITFALSDDRKYLFTNKKLPAKLIEALKVATKSRKIKSLNLSGPNVKSLLKLLRGRECLGRKKRPIYSPNSPNIDEVGINFSPAASFDDYIKKCFSEGVHLNHYTVEAAQKKWVGDDAPELKLIEFKHEISFKGNVPLLLSSLPAAGITQPPFPEYIRDFSLLGRSKVTITSSMPC